MDIANKVLICDQIDNIGIEILKKNGFDVEYQPDISREELLKNVNLFDIIVVRSRTKIDKEIIENAKRAKIIARVGVGLDNIDLLSANDKNIEVINAPEAAMNSVSELVIGLMLSLARNIPTADREMKLGNWMKKELMGTELNGKYLGIIGVGNIGRNLSRIAKGLRMNIIGYDSFPIKKEFINEVGMITTDLKTLVQSSDFISCHIPFTPETRHLFNEDLFSQMKPSAFFINTSRGEIVDENALYNALVNKKIAGAGLDVFEIEPPFDKLFVQLPNVICTPHIGAQTKEAQKLASSVIAEKIIIKIREKERTSNI